jgi:outer membrane protein assembly factor BamA
VWARAERALPGRLRAGAGWRWSDVSFGSPATPGLDLDERMVEAGLDLTLDTRVDPTFPRNAVYARAAWEHLDFDARPSRRRVTLDGRGYAGLIGSTVLGIRAFHGRADGPLPIYEQWLLGGQSTVRGFRAGSAIGDRITTGSLELRMPFSSPLKVAKTGVSVFWDTGTTWDAGMRLADQRWKHGYGAGLFTIATIFQLKLEVAHGSDGDTRLHVGAGFTF